MIKMGKDTNIKITNVTVEADAMRALVQAFNILQNSKKTREVALAITKLEESMMWLNRDRTNKGELEPNPTHVKTKVKNR